MLRLLLPLLDAVAQTRPRGLYGADKKNRSSGFLHFPSLNCTGCRLVRRPLLLGLVLLGACVPIRDQGPTPKDATTLVLHHALEVPRGSARVFLQDGAVVAKGGLNQYRPHCDLEIQSLYDPPRRITPGSFQVLRVQSLMEEVVQLPTRLASLRLAGLGSDSSPSDIFEGYHFWLRAPEQPQLMRLTCRGVFASPAEVTPPSLADIRQALGDIATLHVR